MSGDPGAKHVLCGTAIRLSQPCRSVWRVNEKGMAVRGLLCGELIFNREDYCPSAALGRGAWLYEVIMGSVAAWNLRAPDLAPR